MPQEARIIYFPTHIAKKEKKPGRRLHASGRVPIHFRYEDPITGAKRRKTVYGRTEAEAEKKKTAFLRQVEQGLRVNEHGKTVGQWADDWLRVYKKPHVSVRTYATYKSDIERIKDAMGHRTLKSVTQQDIVMLLATRAGLSASAIKKTAMTAKALFESAVDNRLIPYNPCRGATSPTGTSGTHRALTDREIMIISSVKGHRFSLPVMLMLFAGLRRGEAAAFRAEDVHGDTISVSRSITWIGNTPHLDTPKTQAGIRTIPVFPPLKPLLKSFTGFATRAASGKDEPVTLQAFERGFESFLNACAEKLNGCQKRWQPEDHVWEPVSFRCHDLRHTFATMLYDADVDIKTAQRWLGHSDPAVTMRIYTHLSATREKQAKKAASKHLSKLARGGKIGGTRKTYRLKRL